MRATSLSGELARWSVRAAKGRALLRGRFKGFRGQVTPEVSILLPLAAHAHYWSGLHDDAASIAFLRDNVRSDGVLLDVGANIGVYLSALSSLKGPGLKLV